MKDYTPIWMSLILILAVIMFKVVPLLEKIYEEVRKTNSNSWLHSRNGESHPGSRQEKTTIDNLSKKSDGQEGGI